MLCTDWLTPCKAVSARLSEASVLYIARCPENGGMGGKNLGYHTRVGKVSIYSYQLAQKSGLR